MPHLSFADIGSEPSGQALPSAAAAEMIGMFDPARAPDWTNAGSGYVDLLGNRDPDGPLSGQLFRSRLIPPIYERFWRPVVARAFFGRALKADEELRLAMEMLAISPGDRVLDLGCGTGIYARHLAEAAADGLVVGLDSSAAMLDAATKGGGGSNLAYLRADAAALPFEDHGFDAVCCVGVIHTLEDPLRSLDEMVRVLAPGGRLVLMAVFAEDQASVLGGSAPEARAGVMLFGRDQLVQLLADRGLVGIRQHVLRRAQFLGAQMPHV